MNGDPQKLLKAWSKGR